MNKFDLMGMLPIALMFAVFYFLIIRPQQQKMKTHQDMVANLKKGDRIVTNGGIIGVVSKSTNDHEVSVEIDEKVTVQVVRSMIHAVLKDK
jgi:preprotein translocase subunit YajC